MVQDTLHLNTQRYYGRNALHYSKRELWMVPSRPCLIVAKLEDKYEWTLHWYKVFDVCYTLYKKTWGDSTFLGHPSTFINHKCFSHLLSSSYKNVYVFYRGGEETVCQPIHQHILHGLSSVLSYSASRLQITVINIWNKPILFKSFPCVSTFENK